MTEFARLAAWERKLSAKSGARPSVVRWAIGLLRRLHSRKRVEGATHLDAAGQLGIPPKYYFRALAILHRFGLLSIQRSPALVVLKAQLPATMKPPSRGIPRRSVPASVRALIYEMDEGLCGLSGQPVPFEEAVFDHIIPFAYGGADDPANLVTATRQANTQKLDSLTIPLRRYRGEVVKGAVGMRWKDGAFWPVVNGRVRSRSGIDRPLRS